MIMEKKFYRGKNALSINNVKIETPNKDEVENLLIKKLEEKAHHVGVIYDENQRNNYLEKKNKLEKIKDMPLDELKRFLALRLSVDIMQLATDLAKIYRTRVMLASAEVANLSESDIEKELLWCCEKLVTKKHKDKMIDVISHLLVSYINIFNITKEELESERLKVEQNEGTYLNGKIVIYD